MESSMKPSSQQSQPQSQFDWPPKPLDFVYRNDQIGELPIMGSCYNYPRESYLQRYPHYSLVVNVTLSTGKEQLRLSQTYKENNVTDLEFFIKKSICQLIMAECVGNNKKGWWSCADARVGITQYDQPIL